MKAKPDGEVLNAIPSTMKWIVSTSVKGDALLQFEQIKKTINLISNLPSLDKLDLRGIVASIDGPLTIALAPSAVMSDEGVLNFANDYNITLAAHSSDPQQVLNSIKAFANEMGQPDYEKDGRHVYSWGGLPVYVGAIGNIVYATRLDHEWLEGTYHDDDGALDRFSNSPLGFYMLCDVQGTQGVFNFGFNSMTQGNGVFYTTHDDDNPALVFLQILLGVKLDPKPDANDYVNEI